MPQDERVLNGGIKNDPESKEWKSWVSERERLFLSDGLMAFDLFAPKAAEFSRSAWITRLVWERFPLGRL
jgi:DNA helicase-2/ATP-dependent DNA helicase PcrA